MADTTLSAMAGLITESINRKFIPILRAKLRLDPFAETGRLELRGGSKTLRWNVLTDIGVFTTALGETTTTQNEIVTITVSSVLMTVADYGAFMKLSDLADSVWTAETRQEFADIFSYSGAKTKDTLLRDAAYNTTKYLVSNQKDANTGSVFNTSTANAQDLAVVAGIFNRLDADPFDDIGGNFVLVIHGEQEQDIVTDVTTARLSWSPLLQYTEGNADRIMNYKGPGALLGVAVQRSNNIATVALTVSSTPPSNSGTVNAFKAIGLAHYGIGKTTLDQAEPRVIMKRPGPQTVTVPLDTYGTIGWKMRLAQSLLDSNRCLVFYSAV